MGRPERSDNELVIKVVMVGNMSMRKRRAIAEVFDAHPALRPARVGSYPPRTVVGESLAPHLITGEDELSLVGGTGRRNDDATWFIDFYPEWVTGTRRDETEFVMRSASSIYLVVGPDRVEAAGGPAGIEAFVGALAEASAAAYACVFPEPLYSLLDGWYDEGHHGRPHLEWGLASVYWLQYFGPAFAALHPRLERLPRATVTARGAVLYRAAEHPEETLRPLTGPMDGAWRAPLVDALGEDAFRPNLDGSDSLPRLEQHAAHDPDATAAPVDLIERLAQEAEDRARHRHEEYTRAHLRRIRLEQRRPQPRVVDTSHEVSWNLDSQDVPSTWKRLRALLQPQVTGAYAGALSREMAHAPHDARGEVLMDSPRGAFALSWWVDDEESLILGVEGPGTVVHHVEEQLF